MCKIVIVFFLLFNLYICEEENDGTRIFEVSQQLIGKDVFNVRLGEKFALKFKSNPSTGNSWAFLNEDEVNDVLLFIESKLLNPYAGQINPPIGSGEYELFYFKAIKETDEAISLNFNYGKSSKNNALYSSVVKINVN